MDARCSAGKNDKSRGRMFLARLETGDGDFREEGRRGGAA